MNTEYMKLKGEVSSFPLSYSPEVTVNCVCVCVCLCLLLSLFNACAYKYTYFFKKNLFIYLFIFGCIGSLLLCAGFLQLRQAGATLCCVTRASHCSGSSCCGARALGAGFSSCGTWAQQLWFVGSRAQAQQLWRTGLLAPRYVGSSRTRAQTRNPCIGRQILNHCATRGAPHTFFIKKKPHCMC